MSEGTVVTSPDPLPSTERSGNASVVGIGTSVASRVGNTRDAPRDSGTDEVEIEASPLPSTEAVSRLSKDAIVEVSTVARVELSLGL